MSQMEPLKHQMDLNDRSAYSSNTNKGLEKFPTLIKDLETKERADYKDNPQYKLFVDALARLQENNSRSPYLLSAIDDLNVNDVSINSFKFLEPEQVGEITQLLNEMTENPMSIKKETLESNARKIAEALKRLTS